MTTLFEYILNVQTAFRHFLFKLKEIVDSPRYWPTEVVTFFARLTVWYSVSAYSVVTLTRLNSIEMYQHFLTHFLSYVDFCLKLGTYWGGFCLFTPTSGRKLTHHFFLYEMLCFMAPHWKDHFKSIAAHYLVLWL